MKKRAGGGIGMIMLLVVLVIVLLLVARSLRSVGPEAINVTQPVNPLPGVDFEDHGQPAAGEALRRGHLPDIQEMEQTTDEHAQQVQDALEQIE